MNMLLYNIDPLCAAAVAERYGFRLRSSIEELDQDSCLLLPAFRNEEERRLFTERMLSEEGRIDLIIAHPDENFSVVHYCSEPGRLFTVIGSEDPEMQLEEMIRIIDSLSGLLCAHEETELIPAAPVPDR